MAKVKLTAEAAEGLEGLPLVIHARVLALLERLGKWPAVSGAKPLTGNLAGHYRLRTGDYRLQFRLEGQTAGLSQILETRNTLDSWGSCRDSAISA